MEIADDEVNHRIAETKQRTKIAELIRSIKTVHGYEHKYRYFTNTGYQALSEISMV